MNAVRGGLIGVALLLLGGCVSAKTATYRHPETYAVAVCHKSSYQVNPGFGLLGLITSPLVAVDVYQIENAYATCKSKAEAAGYEKWTP